MSRFKKATRERLKLRMALDGPSGSGKSYTAYRCGFALAKHYGGRVAIIDTESRSSCKYHGEAPDGIPFDFDILELSTFAPTEYTSAIEEAGREGYDVLIIDSLSHAWQGKEGALELVNKSSSKNSFTAWKDVTPMHTRMIEAILASRCHVIATMRSKTEYVLEENDKGKQVPRRVGTAPIQRAGMEYEFDVYGSLDWSHVLTVTKSRCSSVDGLIAVKPGAGFMDPIIRWLDTGEVSQVGNRYVLATPDQITAIVNQSIALGQNMDKLRKDILKRYSVSELANMTFEQAGEMCQRLKLQAESAAKRKNGKAVATTTTTAPVTVPPVAWTNGTHVPAKIESQPTTLPANEPANGLANGAQLLKLQQMRHDVFEHAGILDDPAVCKKMWADILAKRNVTSAKELTEKQAEDLITALAAKIPAPEGFDPPAAIAHAQEPAPSFT